MLLIPYTIILYLVLKNFFLYYKIYDSPDGSLKLHKSPTLIHGGFFFFFALLVINIFQFNFFLNNLYLILPWSLSFVFLIFGLYDDIIRMNYKRKIYIQIIICFLYVLLSIFLFSNNFLNYFFIPVFLFLMIFNINSINIIDNYNGVSALSYLYSIISLRFIFGEKYFELDYTLFFCFFLFLFYNLRKKGDAKIFMGNNGSHFFGSLLSAFFLYEVLIQNTFTDLIFNLAKGLIIFFPFLLDTFLVVFTRISLNLNPLRGSNHHISHVLDSIGIKNQLTSISIFSISILTLVVYQYIGINYSELLALIVVSLYFIILLFFLLFISKLKL